MTIELLAGFWRCTIVAGCTPPENHGVKEVN
jgi:hypothetical protein